MSISYIHTGGFHLILKPGRTPNYLDPIAGILSGLLFVLLTRIFYRYSQWAKRLSLEFAKIFTGISISDIAIISVLSSIGEELLFRGALQPILGIYITSILFGILHFVPRKVYFMWTASAIVMGFALGALWEWTSGILAPVIAHFTINYFNLADILKTEPGQPL